jgi:hypothetical protein
VSATDGGLVHWSMHSLISIAPRRRELPGYKNASFAEFEILSKSWSFVRAKRLAWMIDVSCHISSSFDVQTHTIDSSANFNEFHRVGKTTLRRLNGKEYAPSRLTAQTAEGQMIAS